VWHFLTKSTGLKSGKPGTSSHFSESRDPNYCMLVWPYVQNVPGKNGEISPSPTVYTHRKSAKRSSKDQVKWLNLRSCLVPSRCGASRTIWDCCWSWGILGLSRAAAPPLSPKEQRARKWVNEWVCRPTLKLPVYEIVLSLFAKSECHIQIIKHIWTEMCVFVRISHEYQT